MGTSRRAFSVRRSASRIALTRTQPRRSPRPAYPAIAGVAPVKSARARFWRVSAATPSRARARRQAASTVPKYSSWKAAMAAASARAHAQAR